MLRFWKALLFSFLIFSLCAAASYLVGTRHRPVAMAPTLPQQKPIPATAKPEPHTPTASAGWLSKYGALPLSFVPAAEGRDHGSIEFVSHGFGYSAFLSAAGAEMVMPVSGSFPISHRVLELEWLGANASHARLTRLSPQGGVSNYLLGNEPRRWHRHLRQFRRVQGTDIYPGIDVTYYGSQQQFEFDLTLHPGADPHTVRLGLSGAYKVRLNPDGEVSLLLHEGEVRLKRPDIYQMRGHSREAVAGHYVMLTENQIGIELGPYDHSRAVIIDPVLSYAMVFGGVHGFANDLLTGMALDSSGNAYLTGTTCAPDFQVSPNAFQTVGGLAANFTFTCKDVFVTKIDSTASSLLYSTYLGGSQMDVPVRIAVDSSGSAYITGGTQSSDFPVTAGAYDTTFKNPGSCFSDLFSGCTDAFVTKLSPDGSSLVYSTFLGGSDVDFGIAIALDSSGNAYVGGATDSVDFPFTANAIQQSFGGGVCNSESCFDGFLSKLSADGKALLYSTYLGGNDDDYVDGVAVDSSGNAYVGGGTGSTNFPVTASAYQSSRAGTGDSTDAFLAKVNSTGTQLLYSTYLGGTDTDYATDLVIDASGNSYLVGAAGSPDFPVTAGVFQSTYAGPSPATCSFSLSVSGSAACGDAFVAKLNPQQSGAASLVWSTYLGGSSDDVAFSVAVDSASHVWLTGQADSSNFPVTPDAYLSGTPGAFVSELSANASSLMFSTMLGSGGAMGLSVAVDASGSAYAAGTGKISSTPGVYPAVGNDFVTKFSAGTAPAVTLTPGSLVFGSQPIGSTSSAQSVTLTNSGGSPLALSIAADFINFAETNNCSSSLAAGTSCTINVTFNPTQTGSPGGYVMITDNAPGNPHKVVLGGTSAPKTTAVVSPTLLNFGNQAVTTHSLPQTVKLVNKGSTTLNIASISANLPFKETTTCVSPLAAGASCSIKVTFSPGSTGAFSGTLSVQDDAAGGLQTVALLGNGIQGAAVYLSPKTLTFSPQAPGTTSTAKKVSLENSGNATLNITGILVRDNFLETTTCGASLAPGKKCAFSIQYAPQVAGPHSGSLVIADNAVGEPQVVPLIGLGPAIFFSKNSFNFGTVTVGQVSSSQTLYVTSGGTSPLHISNIALGGTDPGDFGITGGTCKSGTVVKVGKVCTLNLVFKPTTTGARSAQVLFTDDAANSPQSVGLQGTGQ